MYLESPSKTRSKQIDMIRIIGNGIDGKSEFQFNQPRGICVDVNRNELYVSDCNNHRIQVFHAKTLSFLRQIGRGSQGGANGYLNYAVGICLHEERGELFVADTNNHRVSVFDQVTGVYLRSIGSHGTGYGQLASPYGVCVDKVKSQVFVADYENHRVSIFDETTGEFRRFIGHGFGSLPGQLNQPISLCLHEDYLFVADYSNNRVQVFDKDSGLLLRQLGSQGNTNLPGTFNGPRGLCIDCASNILFVSDRENHRIQLYDKNTLEFLRCIGRGPGNLPGLFNRPMELCSYAVEGVLFIVDGYNHRVQVMEVTELLAEKDKLAIKQKSQAAKERKARLVPRGSMIAQNVSFDRCVLECVPATSDESESSLLHFDGLDRLYSLSLAPEEVTMLSTVRGASHMNEDTPLSGQEDDAAQTDRMSEESSDRPGPRANGTWAIESQGSAMLGMLTQLEASSLDPTFFVPAILGASSFMKRGWLPKTMANGVVWPLLRSLALGGVLAKDEGERKALLEGTHALLSVKSRPANLHSMSPGSKDEASASASSSTWDLLRILLVGANHVGKDIGRYGEIGELVFGDSNDFDAPFDRISEASSGAPTRVGSEGNFAVKGTNLGNVDQQDDSANRGGDAAALVSRDSGSASASVMVALLSLIAESMSAEVNRLSPNLTQEQACDASRANSMKQHMRCIVFGQKFVDGLLRACYDSDSPLPSSPLRGSRGTVATPGRDREAGPRRLPEGLEVLLKMVFRYHGLCDGSGSAAKSAAEMDDHGVSYAARDGDFDQTEASLGLRILSFAADYLQTIESHKQVQPANERRTRGRRNIWRLGEPIAVGDLIDAMDKEKSWFESYVVDIRSDGALKVHYLGWGSKVGVLIVITFSYFVSYDFSFCDVLHSLRAVGRLRYYWRDEVANRSVEHAHEGLAVGPLPGLPGGHQVQRRHGQSEVDVGPRDAHKRRGELAGGRVPVLARADGGEASGSLWRNHLPYRHAH